MKEPSTNFPLEDVEALPEILNALNKAGRIDIVTDWLSDRGIISAKVSRAGCIAGSIPQEDIDAIPEILNGLYKAGRIDLVTDWLIKSGVILFTAGLDVCRLILDLFTHAKLPRYEAECTALACELYKSEGRTIDDVANAWNLDSEIVAQRVNAIKILLGVDGVSPGAWADAVYNVIHLVLSSKSPKRECVCIQLALGLDRHEGKSISDISRRWGIARQSAHARVQRVCLALGVPAVDCSKSVEARETYAVTNFRHQPKAA